MDKDTVTFVVTSEDVRSVTSAANTLGVSRMTIYRWINSKKLYPVNFGGTLYIPVTEIERLKKGEINGNKKG